MTAHIDFAALPDAEAARLMAEKDGLSPRPYTTSLDAAVGWLGRMGLMWSRVGGNKPYVAVYRETPDPNTQYCDESPTCPTARALCNAGWAAVAAQEVNHG